MKIQDQFYIDGQWTAPLDGGVLTDVIDPRTEQPFGQVALGGAADVDHAALAARRAFPAFARTSREERIALLEALLARFEAREDELAGVIALEIGSPAWLAKGGHTAMAKAHIAVAIEALRTYEFDRTMGTTLIHHAPIGVAGLITPWNFPASTITCKLVPALATGCTVVLKPSEFTPFSAAMIAEMVHEAGYAPGVLNLVFGNGETVGNAISAHPEIDMVSITGSTRAGVAVAINAAPTVKRVHQELGGKSANVILPSADIGDAVQRGLKMLMMNAGQGCVLPSRMIVPKARMDEVKAAVLAIDAEIQPAGTADSGYMGPVVNRRQFDSIQALIQSGLDEGATALIGGVGRPDGLETGYYVRPTVFIDTRPDMRIVREEIFGPVLVVQAYDDVEQAVALAEDTPYGLGAYVEAGSIEEAREVGLRLSGGQVILNGAELDLTAPFGGFKQSGNGREWGPYAFEAFLETKALVGHQAA